MQPKRRKRWTQSERKQFVSILEDDLVLEMVLTQFPDRTLRALIREAANHDYGYETINGKVTLYSGIRRNSMKRPEAEKEVNSETVEKDLKSSVKEIIPASTLAKNHQALSANELALKILQTFNLSADPEIVYTLSLHIMRNQ